MCLSFAQMQILARVPQADLVFLKKSSCVKTTDQNRIVKPLFIFLLLTAFTSAAQEAFTDFYPDHSVRSQGKMLNGVKEGEWKYYFPAGKLMAIENFKAGLLNGRVEYYYANEKLQGVENWANGVLTDSAV